MNDEVSLASSYYEIIENLSVIWEETSQDLRSIVTNPKHLRRLSNGPMPYPPSSPRLSPKSLDGKARVPIPHPPSPLLSPRSLDGTPRVMNIRKLPLLRKNVLTLGQETISEAEESQENNNATEKPERDSIFVTSLRTGELVTLPLQDDEFTFESCTTGSDMQSVDSIEEYSSDEDQHKKASRRNGKEEPTEDEMIFEIVDELKEELLMIKHARDEAMKALYLHDSPPFKTQRKTISKSEEFLSRLSTITNAPNFGNIGEITDSSSLPDVLPSAKEALLKDESATSDNARATNNSLPAEVSPSLDSDLPETDAEHDSPTTETADPVNSASFPDPLSSLHANTQQVDTTRSSQAAASVEQKYDSALPHIPATVDSSTSASGPPPSNIDAKDPSETTASLSLEETSKMEANVSESVDLTGNTSSLAPSSHTALHEDNGCAPLEAPSTLDSSITPQAAATQNPSNTERTNKNENIAPIEAPSTVDPATPSHHPPILVAASTTDAKEEHDASGPEEKSSKVDQITPARNFALMKKWLISNLKPSFFDTVQRQAFRRKIDGLAGQRRRVHYNSSRLLLKRRLQKHLKAQDRKTAAQKPFPDHLPTEKPNYSDNESIELFVANPQDDSQDGCNRLLGSHRRLRRSSRRRSESDLGSVVRKEKREELRSKIHSIEDRLDRIRMNLSNSFSSFATIENGEESEEDTVVAVEENQRVSRGWSSRSFSEGMLSPDSPPRERKELKGRLERIRGKKKMNLEKLQHALDSAMEAISAEMGS